MDDLYLAHHGILGMKWGVRRYQNEDGSLTDEGRKHYGYGGVREKIQNVKDKVTNFKLTDKQKRNIAIGVGVAGACLAAYGYWKYASINDVSKNPLFDPETGLLKKAKHTKDYDWDILDDIKHINPNADSLTDQTKVKNYFNNCAKCSATYEMRRRGFDVTAGHSNVKAQKLDSIRNYFKNAEEHFVSSGEVKLKSSSFNDFTYGASYWNRLKLVKGKGADKLVIDPIKMDNKFMKKGVFDRAEEIQKALDDAKVFRYSDPKLYKQFQKQQISNLESQCANFGPKARGHITMWFDGNIPSCHSIAFENDASGRPRFIDTQIAQMTENTVTGKRMSSMHASFQHYLDEGVGFKKSLNPFFEPVVTRTDNAIPDLDYLKANEVIKNAGTENLESLNALGQQTTGKILAGIGGLSAGYFGIKSRNLEKTKTRDTENDNVKQTASH